MFHYIHLYPELEPEILVSIMRDSGYGEEKFSVKSIVQIVPATGEFCNILLGSYGFQPVV
jgi:hypothetical protein